MHFIFAIFWVVCVNIFVQPLLSYFAEFSASWHNWRAGVGKGGVGRGRGEELYVTDTFVTYANIHRYPAFAPGAKLVFAQMLVHSLSIFYSKVRTNDCPMCTKPWNEKYSQIEQFENMQQISLYW